MIRVVGATPKTSKLMSSLIYNLSQIKPKASHIDYSVSLDRRGRHINLITDENSGVLRNVSLVRMCSKNPFVKTAQLAIWNETGALRITDKSIFTSVKTIHNRLDNFLESININQSGSPFGGNLKELKLTIESPKQKITIKTEGSDTTLTGEVLDSFMSENAFMKQPKNK